MSGLKSTSESKHGTSRRSVEEFNRGLLKGKRGLELTKLEALFDTPCGDCGELMWVHRTDTGVKICPNSEEY